MRLKSTFPKWIEFSSMLSLTFDPIIHLWPAVSFFSHPTRGLDAISGLCGVGNVVLCLFGSRSDKQVEPCSFGFD